jgi:hypothetical protein
MSADSTLNAFVAQGTTTQRLAFTPTPPTPASGSPLGYYFWDHTLQQMFAYDTTSAAWVAVASVAGTGVTGTGLTSGLVVVGAGGSAITVAANSVVLLHSLTTLTDAQVKALPTTPVQLVATPGAGFWIKPLAVTYQTHVVGAYTNLNATYVDFHQTLDTYYVSYGPVDDSTTTPALTNVTALLTTVADLVQEIGQPNLAAVGASATTQGYVQQVSQAGTGQLGNKPLMMNIDNNGSGNLTGGNASNTLKVKIYYVIEAI